MLKDNLSCSVQGNQQYYMLNLNTKAASQ